MAARMFWRMREETGCGLLGEDSQKGVGVVIAGMTEVRLGLGRVATLWVTTVKW